MLDVAGSRNLPRTQADMRALALRNGCCRLAIAYYSIQHLPRHDLGKAFEELRRVLAPVGCCWSPHILATTTSI